jgi:TonB family protein
MHTGVAVLQLIVNLRGRVASATVLQGPSEAARRAVTEAVSKWEFTPLLNSGNCPQVGRLVFYFTVREGKGSVIEPAEALERKRLGTFSLKH